MTAFVHEIQFQSHGYPGAPGYTNLYFELAGVLSDTNAQFQAVHDALNGIAGQEPVAWSGQINVVGRVLETTSGHLAKFSNTPVGLQAAIPGRAPGGFGAGVAGVVIGYSTATVNRARLVRGRTYVVPVFAGTFEGDGTITEGQRIAFEQVAQILFEAAVGFCVWSRPRLGVGGLTAPVTSWRVTDQAAFLSSRRN